MPVINLVEKIWRNLMKNKILKLFVLLAIILPTCINFVSCDYGTYNIYPESTNESGNGTDNEKTDGSSEKSSEMLAMFKTSKNIGRPIKLKIKISAEKQSALGTLNYYPLSSSQTRATVYCHDNFSIIDPPKINFGGEGNPNPWKSSDNYITFKIKIESDIPPLDDLPIYFADQLLGNLKGFTKEAEFSLSGSANFFFNNYLNNSHTYVNSYTTPIISEDDSMGSTGSSGYSSIGDLHHSHTINIFGNLVNAQSPERIDVYLSGKNILEDFPLTIGEANIPLENVSLKFIFNTSVNFSGTASKSDTNSCCYRSLPDEGGSRLPIGTTYTTTSDSATACWDFSYETERDPILLAPISILVEEENTESFDTDTEADETQSI